MRCPECGAPDHKCSRATIERLRVALEKYQDAVVWMSGASDFAPEGRAHVGWVKLREELEALGVIRE